MGFPRECELDLDKDGHVNTTTWEWERLMLVGPNNHFHSAYFDYIIAKYRNFVSDSL